MMMIKKYSLLLAALSLAACKQSKTEKSEDKPAETNAIAEVFADFETEPVIEASDEDAADDPAFWFNAKDAEKSLILGSNKKLGLEVYSMQGQRIAHYASGRINNIDVVQGFNWGDTVVDIVAGSNRSYGRIDVWAIDSSGTNFQLVSDTNMRSELEDVYGFCLYHDTLNKKVYAFINSKTGEVEQWEISAKDSSNQFSLGFKKMRLLNAGKQVEGMVADPSSQKLYVGVEEEGILVFSAQAEDSLASTRIPLSGEDNPDLKFDIEGLAIHHSAAGKYLLASSQGNNRYAIFDLEEDAKYYVKAFAVVDSVVDGCEETDGIDAISVKLGDKYPQGFMLIQDGYNFDNGEAKAQNFKLVDWQKVAEIL